MLDFEKKKQEILDRVDLVEIVSEHVALRRSGRRLVGLCPFHSERTPSFSVSPEQGLFKCFGCGQGGDLFTFVQLRERVSFIEAMEMLADRAGVDLGAKSTGPQAGTSKKALAAINAWAERFFRANLCHESGGRAARDYVKGRLFSQATVDAFGIGLATGADRFLVKTAERNGILPNSLVDADLIRRNERGEDYETFRQRLMFPIRDATRRVVGFGGRTMIDDPAKYLNTRQTSLFDKGRTLYALDQARESIVTRKRAVVVEGYTDCMAAHQAGFRETVATLGTALTDTHVGMLRRYCDELILLFDSDRAGEAAAERAIKVALPHGVICKMAHLPDGMDPSEFLARSGSDAFTDVLNGAVDALEFKWLQTRDRFQANDSPARQREAVVDFLSVVSEAAEAHSVDAIQRGLMVNQVAHLLRMDGSEVKRMLRGVGVRRSKRETAVPESNGPPPPDEARAAWVRILEVLLNEPTLRDGLRVVLDTELIGDERDRRIANTVMNNHRTVDLSQVLGQFDDPLDVQRVVDLARRGANRGNYESTLSIAIRQLEQVARRAELQLGKERLLRSAAHHQSALNESQEDRELVRVGVKQYRHFVPGRLIRRSMNVDSANVAKPAGPHAAME